VAAGFEVGGFAIVVGFVGAENEVDGFHPHRAAQGALGELADDAEAMDKSWRHIALTEILRRERDRTPRRHCVACVRGKIDDRQL
jgi:hypothetical protein